MDIPFFELTFSEVIILILLGYFLLSPSDLKNLVSFTRKYLRLFLSSKMWKSVTTALQEIQDFPNALIREEVTKDSNDNKSPEYGKNNTADNPENEKK